LALLAASAVVGGTGSYAAGHTAPDASRAITDSRCRSGAYIYHAAHPAAPAPEAAHTGLPASVAPAPGTRGFDRPVVSITFDASARSIHDTALPILERFGLASTDYLTTGDLGRGDVFMTPADVYDLRAAGHEIASHAATGADLTAAADSGAFQLATSKRDLERCFGPAPDVAPPAGDTDPAVREQIARRFDTARSTDAGFNTPSNLDRYGLLVQVVTRDTTAGQLSAWLTTTRLSGSWLILVYQRVGNESSAASRTPADFASDMQAIKDSSIQTLTVHQAFTELSPQAQR
jgi:peptidoglycan/xylan/chitin deacetylase (PgdA/CDA1 family)